MQPAHRRTPSLLLLACALACAPAPAAPMATGAAPTAAAPPQAGPPTTTAPVAGDERFTGRVLERLPAGPYTYLRVATAAGARWVVTMGAAPTSDVVEVRNMGTRTNFHARRLGRDFDELVFGIVAAAASADI
jgi:hypothetical protein